MSYIARIFVMTPVSVPAKLLRVGETFQLLFLEQSESWRNSSTYQWIERGDKYFPETIKQIDWSWNFKDFWIEFNFENVVTFY